MSTLVLPQHLARLCETIVDGRKLLLSRSTAQTTRAQPSRNHTCRSPCRLDVYWLYTISHYEIWEYRGSTSRLQA